MKSNFSYKYTHKCQIHNQSNYTFYKHLLCFEFKKRTSKI